MDGPWLQLVIQLGSFGLLALFVWITVTKTIPEKDKLFADAMKQRDESSRAENARFLETLQAQGAAFREALSQERSENKTNVDRILAAIETQNRLLIFILGRGKALSEDERKAMGI